MAALYKTILKRLTWALIVLFGLSIIIFSLMRVIPGDPARLALGPTVPEEIVEQYDGYELMFMDPKEYDDAIVGVSEVCGKHPAVVYDEDKVIDVSMSLGMTYDEAVDHFYYNQIGGYLGKSTPTFLTYKK